MKYDDSGDASRKEWAVRPIDLQAILLRHRPQIVHFSGHGDSGGQLVFEDDQGNAQVAPVPALKGLFSLLGDGIRCVVLNACYSKPQAEAISRHIDCVLAIRSKPSSKAIPGSNGKTSSPVSPTHGRSSPSSASRRSLQAKILDLSSSPAAHHASSVVLRLRRGCRSFTPPCSTPPPAT